MQALRRVGRFVTRGTHFVINRVVWKLMNRYTLWVQNVRCDEMPRINGLLRVRNEGVLEFGPS